MDENTLMLVISQSGETADTIAALREAKELGSKVLAICNVFGSMIRERRRHCADSRWSEIGVASTKAFTCQMVALYLLGLYLGNIRGALSAEEAKHHAQQLAELRSSLNICSTSRMTLEALSKNSPRHGFSLSWPRHKFSRGFGRRLKT